MSTNITKVTIYRLELCEEDLRANLYKEFASLLNDNINDPIINPDIVTFEMNANRLINCMNDISRFDGFTDLFKEGYADMLLSKEDFEYVDDWIQVNGGNTSEELHLVIDKKNGDVEIVKHRDIFLQ